MAKADDFRAALREGKFDSVRGKFKMGANQHPVQDYFLTKFEKNADGKIVQNVVNAVATDHVDHYAANCKMN